MSEQPAVKFRWWYRGILPSGMRLSLSGTVLAPDTWAACDQVEQRMRAKYPTMKWMQGRRIEGNGVSFGPTVQKAKMRKSKEVKR